MKSTIFAVALGATLAAAQLPDLPKCATECVSQIAGGSSIGGCDPLDIKCICNNDGLLDNIACCLTDKCDEAGQKAAIEAARSICSSAGVETPDEVTCRSASSSSAPSGSTTAAQNSASTASGETQTTSTGTSPTGDATTATTDPAATGTNADDDEGAANALTRGAAVVGGLVAMVLAL